MQIVCARGERVWASIHSDFPTRRCSFGFPQIPDWIYTLLLTLPLNSVIIFSAFVCKELRDIYAPRKLMFIWERRIQRIHHRLILHFRLIAKCRNTKIVKSLEGNLWDKSLHNEFIIYIANSFSFVLSLIPLFASQFTQQFLILLNYPSFQGSLWNFNRTLTISDGSSATQVVSIWLWMGKLLLGCSVSTSRNLSFDMIFIPT